MSEIVAIGDDALLAGYAAVGVTVLPARDAGEAVAAWEARGRDAALLLLTPDAGEALAARLVEHPQLRVVLPR